jgi:hypothetical protein
MKNIHILQQTDKPSRLHEYDFLSPMGLSKEPLQWRLGRNIYITNDAEIKEGDFYLHISNDINGIEYTTINNCHKPHRKQDNEWYVDGMYSNQCKKIILTTDQDLIKDGVEVINDDFLEWFVNNPSCEKVEVVKTRYDGTKSLDKYWSGEYKIIIPKEEPKQYKCTECNWLGLFDEMKNEQDTDYDQYCCPKCNNVMYDCRLHKWYLEEPKQKTIEEVLKKIKSIKLCLMAHPNNEVDSEFADRITDLEEIQIELSKDKWQQKRSYSEEEVLEQLNILMSLPSSTLDKFTDKNGSITKEWFEQFKKK